MRGVDAEILAEIASGYSLHPATFVPALVIIAMALLRYDVKLAMLISIASGAAIALWAQGVSPAETLSCMIWGYTPQGGGRFAQIIAGGGLTSMMGTIFIILIASGYSGIFEGAGLLDGVLSFLKRSTRKWASYPITLVTSIFAAILGCNQTLTIVLTHQLTQGIYKERNAADGDLALDLEDTAVLVAVLVPWNIAVATPLAILGAGPASIPYAFFLYLLPLCRLFTRRPKAAPNPQ